MPYAKASDGCMLYYKDWGRGHPIVLLHGWPLTADTWDSAAMRLAQEGHRVIFPDRRGFGRSDQPFTGYDYDTFTDDVVAVLDHAGVSEPVGIVGFSMGGGEVARFVSKQGKGRVSHAALISSVVPLVVQRDDNPDGVPQSKLDEIMEQLKTDRAKFMTTFVNQFYGMGYITQSVSDEVIDNSWHQAMMAGEWPTIAAAKAWATTDFRPDLQAFSGIPTLIIHGTADQNVPIDATGRAAARAIPEATFIEYDGSPHGLFETEKQRFCDDLSAFFSGDMSRLNSERTEVREEEEAY